MLVTLTDVMETTRLAMGIRAIIHERSNTIMFWLKRGTCHMRAQLVLDDKYLQETPAQSLSVLMTLVETNGTELSFTRQPFSEVLAGCYELQRVSSWGTLLPVQHSNGCVNVFMTRRCNISTEDLLRAKQQDVGSEFITSIAALAEELETAAPALQSLAAGTLDAQHIKNLMSLPRNTILM